MSSELLGISVSGLRAAQTKLNTTGNNISNAGVEGYSRQRVEIVTNNSTLRGEGYVGTGVNVGKIERIVDDFVNQQFRQDTTLYKDLEIYHSNISQLDNLLSNVASGLSSALESFYASMQNGADDPTSIPARQLILSEAENLADRFNTIDSRFDALRDGVNESMTSAVAQINTLVANVADLNRKIADSVGAGGGASPSELLDEREKALKELSSLVSLQTYDQGGGQINVVIGSGQNLVVGTNARQLELVPSEEDIQEFDVVFKSDIGQQRISDRISGGELGGLFRFRDSLLGEAYSEFGRIALVMADEINKTHQQGINLNDEFGGRFFFDVNSESLARDRVIGNSGNAAPQDRVLSLNITDGNQLRATDYEVSIERGGLFRIERISDGAEVARDLLNGSYPFTVAFDGLKLIFEGGSFQEGDQFALQPTKAGAKNFSSALTAPEDIAFASPLVTDNNLSNEGSGRISAGEVLSLQDANGQDLPLFASPGEISPPLIVKFTTNTTYDILDNSDPGAPVQLNPPIRNRTFVPGVDNPIFPENLNETQLTTNGVMTGLAEGRSAVRQASLQMEAPTAVAPTFAVTDFSAATNQFAFDLVISNTLGDANDATQTITITGPAIVDNDALLQQINVQLSTTDARAYIADNGTLAFRLNSRGYGDISLQNYNADPDAGGNNAPAGQANALLGFDIEASTFTTIANANGFSGLGRAVNGYPSEAITVSTAAEFAGGDPTIENIFSSMDGSARSLASALSNANGVEARAFNYVEFSNLDASLGAPLQLTLNGENLLEYAEDPTTGAPVLSPRVPDPQTSEIEFYDYIAGRINNNDNLRALGVVATATLDNKTSTSELQLYSHIGEDFDIGFTASSGATIDVSDGVNDNLTLLGMGVNVSESIIVGGRIDVAMGENVSLSTFPGNSMIFGDLSQSTSAVSTYLGIQAEIGGIPRQGDSFTLDFNKNAAFDNRNALKLVDIESKKTIGGGVSSVSEGYASLVEKIGIETASVKINLDASEQVLSQTETLRNSISGVNLDEEAADLIRYEQLYSANAQVINVSRDLFDRLISIF